LGPTLDALAASHAIGAQTALAVKAVIALLVAPARAAAPSGETGGQTGGGTGGVDTGGGAAVDLPVSLEDRVLSVQRIPLIRLPALVWP
ncbi:hypothetical protein, partial [Acidisphaera rubrifaciens]|uniref:hypothetical protein n=1 Tax=Acidisphaera rubrifaciens TaxID=50715 RepID=UPI00066223B6